jgi:transcriptional regulator with XRE-family HTH domain
METNLENLVFVPQKLREARQRKFPEWSLRRVARDFYQVLRITPQTLSDYETGRISPDPDRLARMCALYGVELSELTETSAEVAMAA